MEEKRGRGQPKKTLENLPKNWEEIIENSAKVGAGITEIRVAIGVLGDEWHQRMMEEEPNYSAAIKDALRVSEHWWLNEGRIALRDKTFNAVLWYMNMKNRFGWKDKTEHSGDAENPVRMIVVGKE